MSPEIDHGAEEAGDAARDSGLPGLLLEPFVAVVVEVEGDPTWVRGATGGVAERRWGRFGGSREEAIGGRCAHYATA